MTTSKTEEDDEDHKDNETDEVDGDEYDYDAVWSRYHSRAETVDIKGTTSTKDGC